MNGYIVCCFCGIDVAGLPVMRDNGTGLECCKACSFRIGGPAEFAELAEYIDRNAIRGVRKPAVSPGTVFDEGKVFVVRNDKPELNWLKSLDPAERQRYKHILEIQLEATGSKDSSRRIVVHRLELLRKVERKMAKKKTTTHPEEIVFRSDSRSLKP